MRGLFRRVTNAFVAVVISATSPVPFVHADSSTPTDESADLDAMSSEQKRVLGDDIMLSYFGNLDQERPDLTEFAMGEPFSEQMLWSVEGGNPLLDADPYFMRSQNWFSGEPSCEAGVCFRKSDGHLVLNFAGVAQAVDLHENLTPLLETQDYVLLAADSTAIFQSKTPSSSEEPGEGFFFINKKDVPVALDDQAPVPIFFFPLPGPGWGPSQHSFEFSLADQIVLYNAEGFGLPIDTSDVALIEKVERNNLMLGQTWSFLEGQVSENGVALPKPNSTLSFGLFLSGQLPRPQHDLAQGPMPPAFSRMASRIANQVLPKASADTTRPTFLQKLRDMYTSRWNAINSVPRPVDPVQLDLPLNLPPLVEQYARPSEAKPSAPLAPVEQQLTLDLRKPKRAIAWKSWITPGVMYGSTAVAAWAVAPHVDWTALITEDMPQRIANVAMLMGGVLAGSVAMKYTVHKALFEKKYPKTPYETKVQRLYKEHKGILDELVHGLWFSLTITPQGMRQILDFYKDRFFPGNTLVQTAWESTVGFMIRQSSRLAMNWKTFYLGSGVFGMADATLVAVDELIFMPFLVHTFHWNLPMGPVTSAYVSALVLGNFLGYLQHGAHDYSASTKMIYMRSAEVAARHELALQGFDPDATKNQARLNKIAQDNLETRFKAVGLPGDDEFLYDPITFIEGVVDKVGFSTESLTADQQKEIEEKNLILRRRHFGLIKPSLQLALENAVKANAQVPSETGQQVIRHLEWVLGNRSMASAIGGRAWDVAASEWAGDALKDSMLDAASIYINGAARPTPLGVASATFGGAINYLALDSTKTVRDIRLVMLLMSNSGSADEVLDYLPQSWIDQAGSPQAGRLSARLIHDAFHAYLARDSALINSDASVEQRFGSRADAELNQIKSQNPTAYQDPFAQVVQRRELIGEMKQQEESRSTLLRYNPFYYVANSDPEDGVVLSAIDNAREVISKANYDLFVKRQWDSVRDMTNDVLNATTDDGSANLEWAGLAKRFNQDSNQKIDPNVFTSRYRYRMIVAQRMAQKVGLWVNDPEQSEFVQKVLIKAVGQTEKQLGLPTERHYSAGLDSDLDREFFAAQVFTSNFINNYIALSVNTDEHLSGSSPEFPGIGQRVRRALVGAPGGRAMSAVVRSFEGLWRNEDNSYAPGLGGFLNRNIPILPDSFRNFTRNLRVTPYVLTFSYITSYYLWQIHTPYIMYVVGFLLGFSNSTFVEINNRMQRFFDKRPMGSVPNNLTYSFVHSRLTNPQIMIEGAFAETIVDSVQGEMRAIGNTIEECEKLLVGGGGP